MNRIDSMFVLCDLLSHHQGQSEKAVDLIFKDDVDSLIVQLDNRCRLENMIAKLYEKIIMLIDSPEGKFDEDYLPALCDDFKTFTTAKNEIDILIVDYLTREKSKVTVELERTFKAKQKIKGYNLKEIR